MRMPWNKPKAAQLDLLDELATEPAVLPASDALISPEQPPTNTPPAASPNANAPHIPSGQPLMVPVTCLCEDPNNPRTEFPDADLEELAADIAQHGVLQPLVVHPADSEGRYRIHFGAKRLRAAIRASLAELPVVIRDMPADSYAQAAENQRRHGLSPLDMARLIRARVDAGDSNATIARQLGMNLTAVAHHLSLLELPPALDDVLKSGRCTSPRTLHELSKLHAGRPGQVHTLLASGADITRAAVSSIRSATDKAASTAPVGLPLEELIANANAACDRLERALSRIKPADDETIVIPELVVLRTRVKGITKRWLLGSDRQTPSQADR